MATAVFLKVSFLLRNSSREKNAEELQLIIIYKIISLFISMFPDAYNLLLDWFKNTSLFTRPPKICYFLMRDWIFKMSFFNFLIIIRSQYCSLPSLLTITLNAVNIFFLCNLHQSIMHAYIHHTWMRMVYALQITKHNLLSLLWWLFFKMMVWYDTLCTTCTLWLCVLKWICNE